MNKVIENLNQETENSKRNPSGNSEAEKYDI